MTVVIVITLGLIAATTVAVVSAPCLFEFGSALHAVVGVHCPIW